MAAYDTRAVTPFVLGQLRTAIAETPKGERPNYYAAALVLTHLARWAKHGGVVNDAVSQIAGATLVPERMVRRSLRALEMAGITESLHRGGGRGRLGTRRVLWLDYHLDGRLIEGLKADQTQTRTPTVQTD